MWLWPIARHITNISLVSQGKIERMKGFESNAYEKYMWYIIVNTRNENKECLKNKTKVVNCP